MNVKMSDYQTKRAYDYWEMKIAQIQAQLEETDLSDSRRDELIEALNSCKENKDSAMRKLLSRMEGIG